MPSVEVFYSINEIKKPPETPVYHNNRDRGSGHKIQQTKIISILGIQTVR
jgi:hypothetical protein